MRKSIITGQATSLSGGPAGTRLKSATDRKKPQSKVPRLNGSAARNTADLQPHSLVNEPLELPVVPQLMAPNEAPKVIRLAHREIIARLCQDGISPIEVMVENMRFAHNRAGELLKEIVGELPEKVRLEEGREELFDKFKEMMRHRQMSQDCARDAAPYLHPRLQTIEVKGDENKPINVVRRVIVDVGISHDERSTRRSLRQLPGDPEAGSDAGAE
jgi:hypothetical protein